MERGPEIVDSKPTWESDEDMNKFGRKYCKDASDNCRRVFDHLVSFDERTVAERTMRIGVESAAFGCSSADDLENLAIATLRTEMVEATEAILSKSDHAITWDLFRLVVSHLPENSVPTNFIPESSNW